MTKTAIIQSQRALAQAGRETVKRVARRFAALERKISEADTELTRVAVSLATSKEACDELLTLLPGGFASFRVREIRQTLSGRR